jgi:hypothetical protein
MLLQTLMLLKGHQHGMNTTQRSEILGIFFSIFLFFSLLSF